jgi:hypothetical protein
MADFLPETGKTLENKAVAESSPKGDTIEWEKE